jgi:hypothetical protein
MELRIMPLFSLDSGDDTTVEKQLKWVESVYNFYGFKVIFWPYRTKNSRNTIPLKDLIVLIWVKSWTFGAQQLGFMVPR